MAKTASTQAKPSTALARESGTDKLHSIITAIAATRSISSHPSILDNVVDQAADTAVVWDVDTSEDWLALLSPDARPKTEDSDCGIVGSGISSEASDMALPPRCT